MICIRCNWDCKYPERPAGKCPSCGGKFAFEPRTGDPVTDALFWRAIQAASSEGTVRFTPEHVYYQVVRRKRRGTTGRNVGLGVGALLVALTPIMPGFLFFGIGSTAVGLALWPKKLARFTRETFDRLWQRWIETHDTPRGLIVRRDAGPFRGDAELQNYSFDRAVICDTADTVDVLLANNFHFENNCAVLSVDGYPSHVFRTVKKMLKNNPRLVVYALHDASSKGCELPGKLASDPDWFRGLRVVEVGLRPAHAAKFPGMWQRRTQPPSRKAALTARERRWLDTYELALAVLPPEQIIKRLYKAIASEQALEPSSKYFADEVGGADFYVDAWSLGDHAGASDGGPDAFG